MPVTCEVDKTRDFATVTFAGAFNRQDVEKAVADFVARGGMTCRHIFEFRQPQSSFGYEAIRDITQGLAGKSLGRPVAFVGDNDLAFEVCSTIVRFIGEAAPCRAFTSRAEAEVWLKTA